MKKKHPKVKARLHPRSKHRGRYDFTQLIKSHPALTPFVHLNAYDDESINFFDPEAVKVLNSALLKHYYGIDNWNIPPHYLCPPIPGRADYVHHIADLLADMNDGNIPKGEKIKCLDIGMGANCIYPIVGHQEYGWSFVGSDIDPVAITSANKTIASNPALQNKVELRLQTDSKHVFQGVIQEGEHFDLTICNPPFYASSAEAKAATKRKLSNLKGKRINKPTRNFGGQNNEVWCPGGEEAFIQQMIIESKQFAKQCSIFSTLVSKQATLEPIYKMLTEVGAKRETIPMGQGNKFSRIVAWRF